ncbi:MAG: HAMP domain-containing histidine kinase [Cyclobacteriaceae bacterium]|nr:HAMP domain-containing histidine kinase [Cyclobacteriaceae bacterium]
MKLLSYTTRLQLFAFLLLFGIFSTLFYLVLSWNVLQNVDEVLYNRKMNLLAYLEKHPELSIAQDNPLDDFTFYPIDINAFQNGKESYADTLIYEPIDAELDEYRKLVTFVKLNNNYYKLEIVKPHLEATEIIGTIAITLGGLFFGLAFCFYLSNRMLSRRIWQPFYAMLDKLKNYNLDNANVPAFPNSKIEEFQLLNNVLTELTRKNKEVFENQKQFIGDASHELQTPLSIIQSKLEALVGQTQLTEAQATIIEGIIGSTQRIKKLNKTLLLLSKIENRQFLKTDEVRIKEIINKSLEYFEEHKEALNIQVEVDIEGSPVVQGNNSLVEVLIQNLLKNAFVHNLKNGQVTVIADKQGLTVTNTSNERIDQEKLFQRFYKSSNNPESWGLGLAIAYKIAQVSDWELEYSHSNVHHTFTVHF